MKKNDIQKLLEKIEGRQPTSDKFHAFTKNKKLDTSSIKAFPDSWTKIHFKIYPRFDRIYLQKPMASENNLSKTIMERKSVRQFSGSSISKKDLSYLLFLSCGLTRMSTTLDESRRPYPSAGARYPLEVYPLILNCEGIEKGLYHYNVKENSLELLLKRDLDKWLIKATGGEKWTAKASAIFIITGVLDRTRIKYGDRGYRYVLIEAGHLAQNICLLTTELKLENCPICGYVDDEVNKLLDIDLQKEVTLYLIAVGKA